MSYRATRFNIQLGLRCGPGVFPSSRAVAESKIDYREARKAFAMADADSSGHWDHWDQVVGEYTKNGCEVII